MDTGSLTCNSHSEVSKFFNNSKGDSFRAAHVNIGSLRKHWDEFCVITSSTRPVTEVFVLTEINVTAEDLRRFTLPGYKVFSYTRQDRRGGGVAVFVKDTLVVTEISVTFFQAEVIALRLNTPIFSLVLFAVYRPPRFNGRLFLAELDQALSESVA